MDKEFLVAVVVAVLFLSGYLGVLAVEQFKAIKRSRDASKVLEARERLYGYIAKSGAYRKL